MRNWTLATFASLTLAGAAVETGAATMFIADRFENRIVTSTDGVTFTTFATGPSNARGVSVGADGTVYAHYVNNAVYAYAPGYVAGTNTPTPIASATQPNFAKLALLEDGSAAAGLYLNDGSGATNRYALPLTSGASVANVVRTNWSSNDIETAVNGGTKYVFLPGGSGGLISRVNVTNPASTTITNGSAVTFNGNAITGGLALAIAPNGDFVVSSGSGATKGLYLLNDPFGSHGGEATRVMDLASGIAGSISDIEFDPTSDTGTSATLWVLTIDGNIGSYNYNYATKSATLLGSSNPGTLGSQPLQIAFAVPEPASVTMLALSGLLMFRRRA